MSEVDYQMALLLQYKFEQEHKQKPSTVSDQQLAMELQQQFQQEVEIERPSNSLVYKKPNLNTSKCLVDPSWEVIDPTPDIHVLFMAFNQKFFWNSLGSVTVSWSKRMTTCAGICSYQGRGGMCSITLSEPLLKLRPRKDLVETLLHEMIHAYLFVTNNNRDRDGHGPEFHKHMYRINAEAGTNITVYHDFHDEVRLYQQHWWRCDGPCQSRKPYFGMIRRATNRAPGPNDRWWEEHMRTCGGNFIKVKSPEKPEKSASMTTTKKVGTNSVNPKNDIRKYISSTKNNNIQNNQNNDKENHGLSSNSGGASSLANKVHTVTNLSNSISQVSEVIPSKAGNIFGFTNLTGTSNVPKKTGGNSLIKGAVKNAGGSTFVVTKKGSKNVASSDDAAGDHYSSRTSASNVQAFTGTGRSLSNSSSSHSNNDYSKVREHWLKKFEQNSENSCRTNTFKRPNSSPPCRSDKVPKLCNSGAIQNNVLNVECPVCQKRFNEEDLNSHLDICLECPNNDTKECIICSAIISSLEYEKHVTQCSEKHFGDFDDLDDIIECNICSERIESKSYENHKKFCREKNNEGSTQLTEQEIKHCPVCKESLNCDKYDLHVEKCVLKMCDELDKKYEHNKEEKTPCLACNKQIVKSELNSHLEECMSITNVFDNSIISEDPDVILGETNSKNEGSYNCPFCLKLVLECEMQNHLDICLNIDQSSLEKSLLVESLCSTDSDLD